MSTMSKSFFRLRALSSTFAFRQPHSTRPIVRLLAPLAALSLVGGMLLTGCGGGGGSSSPAPGAPGAPGSGTGTFNVTFSNPSGTNAMTSAFSASKVLAQTNSGAITLLNATGFYVSGANTRSFTLGLEESGPIQAGKSYTFVSPSASTLTYTESAIGTAHGWTASGGSAIVDSITGKNYKIRIVNATFTTSPDNNSGATGSFTINGTVDATLP
jgi:hypothetical protein